MVCFGEFGEYSMAMDSHPSKVKVGKNGEKRKGGAGRRRRRIRLCSYSCWRDHGVSSSANSWQRLRRLLGVISFWFWKKADFMVLEKSIARSGDGAVRNRHFVKVLKTSESGWRKGLPTLRVWKSFRVAVDCWPLCMNVHVTKGYFSANSNFIVNNKVKTA